MQIMMSIMMFMMFTITSNSRAMECSWDLSQDVKDPRALLENKGKLLKSLIADETRGNFSPQWVEAEETLEMFLYNNSAQELQNTYDQKVIKLAQRIAQRGNDYNKVYAALAKYDFEQAGTIISKNKYCLNYAKPNVLLSNVTDSSIAKFLIALGANVNQKNIMGKTPLFYVLGYPDITSLFLHHGARINEVDDDGNTILHDALTRNLRLREYAILDDRIEFLLSKGVNPEICNKKGKSCIDIVCKHRINAWNAIFAKNGYLFFSHTHKPFSHADKPCKNPYMLLKNNAAYLKKLVAHSKTAKLYSALLSLIELFDYCKKQNSFSVLSPSNKGIFINEKRCLFKHASYKDCKELFGEDTLIYAQDLIKAKRNVKEDLKLLLYESAEKGNTKILESILDIIFIGNKQWQNTILHKAIEKYNNQYLQCCLEKGFTPEGLGNCNKQYPLDFALQCNNVEGVKLLVKYGYDNVYQIKNAWEEAILLGYKDCAKVLKDCLQLFLIPAIEKHSCEEVRLLVKMDLDVNKKDQEDSAMAPLHYAAQVGCSRCVQLLIDNKAEINEYDGCDYQPIHYVLHEHKNVLPEHKGFFAYELLLYLLEHGAVVDKDMIEREQDSVIKELLQRYYDKQRWYDVD